VTLKTSELLGKQGVGQLALDEPLEATLARWREESLQLAHLGVYDWLSSRVAGTRVLEIGCGFGASTAALVRGEKTVFALDNRMDCLEATRQLVPQATYGVADLHQYDARLIDDLKTFAPDAVVCWLSGAPADALPRDVPAAYAVMQHRLLLQRAVVRLATALDSVQRVHLADRTAFPWKMKDSGRQTMCKMIASAVINDAPFTMSASDVQFRKLDIPRSLPETAALQGVVPLIGEATLKRRHNDQ
jgi:SAM-dependent methyltransferase